MTETQQYRVVADRDKGDDPDIDRDYREGDRLVFENWDTGYYDERQVGTLVRIERPVPTTVENGEQFTPSTEQVRSHYVFDQSNRWDAERGAAFDRWLASVSSLHRPTREQIAEALDGLQLWTGVSSAPLTLDKSLSAQIAYALIQNGADR